MTVHTSSDLQRRAGPTQRSSHASLSCATVRAQVPPSSRSGRVDAVIVPASRGAIALEGAAHLAVRLGATLVALCSQQTVADEVAARFAWMPYPVLVIDIPADFRHDLMPTRTVAERFLTASGNRQTDLSLKRNLGLLLARLLAWGKILFLDDDIGDTVRGKPVGLPTETVRRLAVELDEHQIAGLTCREFPDNSVVCHARRLAGLPQDTFVTGAALGVNCNDHPLPFFPDLYNEDWFFFSRRVAARNLAHVGNAIQMVYDPFETPDRARQEEFGDLLAEGLYALFEEQPVEMNYLHRLEAADARYWDQFIAVRRDTLTLIGMCLEMSPDDGSHDADRRTAANRSVGAAADQLSRLSPELCVDYLNAWAHDLVGWERATQGICSVSRIAEAMDMLGLRQWWAGNRAQITTTATASSLGLQKPASCRPSL